MPDYYIHHEAWGKLFFKVYMIETCYSCNGTKYSMTEQIYQSRTYGVSAHSGLTPGYDHAFKSV